MNNFTIRRTLLGVAAVVAIALVGLVAWNVVPNIPEEIRASRAFIGGGGMGGGHALYATDLSDDKRLVGFADSVFFGQVLEELGNNRDFGFPETQFQVKVLEVLKGSLEREVIVNQIGGNYKGTFTLADGDPLLEPGKNYLFVSRAASGKDDKQWHTVPNGYGDIPIQGVAKDASDEEILDSPHTKELRERFTFAVENEIPYDPDEDLSR
jgi:hypothetical protein